MLDDKAYLIESRLSSLAQRDGFGDLDRLLAKLREANSAVLQSRVVEALTTNETLFFRDGHPFEALQQKIIPDLLARHRTDRRLRIWSAASSTGQEAYSVAMLMQESVPQIETWNIEILATDISTGALEKARQAVYSQVEVNRGLPAGKLLRYFEETPEGWRVKPQIRQMVRFQQMNLVDRWPVQQPFDIILLRNVMIYFDTPLRQAILAKVAEQLSPGGYLFMGTGETPVALSPLFEVVVIGRTAVYCRKTS